MTCRPSNDQTCSITAPTERAGHGSAYDSERNVLWIFGGYRTYYPYLRTDGEGSGPGVQSVGFGGFIPFPSYGYFLNDLWYYDFASSLWTEVPIEVGQSIPDPRVDPVFLLLGEILFLHGRYRDIGSSLSPWHNLPSSLCF